MLKILKRLSPGTMAAAFAFLLVQVIATLYLPYLTADIVNNGVMAGNVGYVWPRGAMMIAVAFICFVSAIVNSLFFSQATYKLGSKLRTEIYRKTLSFSKLEFDKIGTSALVARSANDVTQVQTVAEFGCKNLLLALSMLVGGIVMTYLLSPALSIIYLGLVPFLAASYFVIYRFASPLYEKIRKLLDDLSRLFREGLTGVKVIRAFVKEGAEYEKYKAVNREYTHNSVTAETIMSVFTPLITLIISIGGIAITWAAGKGIAAGSMEVGAVIGAIGYSLHILRGFGMLTQVILAIPRGQISANRINEILDMPLSIKDGAKKLESGAEIGLKLDGVDFRHQSAERKTLEDVSFELHCGQTLAIIGSTGAGKSSLASLLARLYDAESGSIKIIDGSLPGGTDIRELPLKELHSLVSYSPQKSMLFLGTVRSNMRIAKPDATDDEIWAALQMADAREFIQSLDDTVEKAGGNYSGGQRQRLCIARTLLKDAAIYVFDDSFSALDFKTDAKVRSAMRTKAKGSITVIVAQRISTVMDADLIAVLDDGRIKGIGTHDELKDTNEIYKEIINSQFYKEAKEA